MHMQRKTADPVCSMLPNALSTAGVMHMLGGSPEPACTVQGSRGMAACIWTWAQRHRMWMQRRSYRLQQGMPASQR